MHLSVCLSVGAVRALISESLEPRTTLSRLLRKPSATATYQVILNTYIVWWNAWNQTYSIMSYIIPITFFISYYLL